MLQRVFDYAHKYRGGCFDHEYDGQPVTFKLLYARCSDRGVSGQPPSKLLSQTTQAYSHQDAEDYDDADDAVDDAFPTSPVLCRNDGSRRARQPPVYGSFVHVRGVTAAGRSIYVQVSNFPLYMHYDVCSAQEPKRVRDKLCAMVVNILHRSLTGQKGYRGFHKVSPFVFKKKFCKVEILATIDGFDANEPAWAGAVINDETGKAYERGARVYVRVQFNALRDWLSERRNGKAHGQQRWTTNNRRQVLVPREPYATPESSFFERFGLTVSDWCTVNNTRPNGQGCLRTTYANVELFADYAPNVFAPAQSDAVAPILNMCYDIEAYTPHKSKQDYLFPQAERAEDCVITFGFVLDRCDRERRRGALCLKQSAVMPGVDVFCFDDEASLLQAVAVLLQTLHPEIASGFNTMGFDNAYLAARASKLFVVDFDYLGCTINARCPIERSELSSNAMGDNEMWFSPLLYDCCPLDVFHWFKNNYKCDQYSLNALSRRFLNGQEKVDLPYNAMMDLFGRGEPNDIAKIAEYCIMDCDLPLDLMDAVDGMFTLFELSKVTHTPITRLCTRGQSERVLNQILRQSHRAGALVTFRPPEAKEKYEGALCLQPVRGLYKTPVCTLDFEALYPSIMKAHNLCYSTQLPKAPLVTPPVRHATVLLPANLEPPPLLTDFVTHVASSNAALEKLLLQCVDQPDVPQDVHIQRLHQASVHMSRRTVCPMTYSASTKGPETHNLAKGVDVTEIVASARASNCSGATMKSLSLRSVAAVFSQTCKLTLVLEPDCFSVKT